MALRYRVIDERELRKPFDAIAFAGVPWRTFAERFAIPFTENDGRYSAPGPMGYAAVELSDGRQFPLEHGFDYPEPGVWVSGKVDQDMDDQRAAIAEALGLGDDVFQWVRKGNQWFDAATGEEWR